VKIFNEAFMREIRLWGRAYELGLMAEMKLRTHNLMGDMDLGMKMLAKNKFPFLPSPSHPPRKVKAIPGADDAIAYYPGCSLHSTSPEFNTSVKAVCEALELKLIEPTGWMCCGSSARKVRSRALRLPWRTLLIEQRFHEVTMPAQPASTAIKRPIRNPTPRSAPPGSRENYRLCLPGQCSGKYTDADHAPASGSRKNRLQGQETTGRAARG
jgi:hypothetical protein